MKSLEHKIYRSVSYILAIAVIGYIGISQIILEKGLYKKADLQWFTGEVSLILPTDAKLALNSDIENLDILLYEDIHSVEIDYSEFQHIQLSDDKRRIQVTINKDAINNQIEKVTSEFKAKLGLKRRILNPGGNLPSREASEAVLNRINKKRLEKKTEELRNASKSIAFLVNGDTASANETHKIKSVKVDGKLIPITVFYEDYVIREKSNLAYHIPMELRNLSRWLAVNMGQTVMSAIQIVLIFLFVIQASLFFICALWKPSGVREYFSEQPNSIAMTKIDYVSKVFSIPLGFLGTVVSIWVALELNGGEFGNFEGILSVFKVAIFTSVLGLGVHSLCLLRSLGFSLSLDRVTENER